MKRYHDIVFFKHNVKTILKAGLLLFLGLLFMQLLICTGLMNISVLETYDWTILLKFIWAKLISFINPSYSMDFINPDGTLVTTSAYAICNNQTVVGIVETIIVRFSRYWLFSSMIYLFIPVGLVILLKSKNANKKNLYVRGAKLLTVQQYNSIAKKRKETLDLPFGSVKMPASCEEKNTLIVGKPGSGKTTLLTGIFSRLRERKERLIIYDFKGDFVEKFYSPDQGDIIFNPFDRRAVDWRILSAEIFSLLDIDAVAASLIPDLTDTTADPFWSDGARDVVASILFYLLFRNFRRNSDVWKMVSSDGKNIATNLKKTPGCEKGYKYIVEHKSKQALSILAVVMQYCSCFQYMLDGDDEFSINNWVENGTGNIFITNNAMVQDSLKPILSLFIDLLARKILSMPDYTMKKTTFLLDEFTTLQKLPSLINLLTLGRSKRASCYLGTQSFGQIENIYGKAHKESIINACGNKAIFSMADSSTAKYCSELIGEVESVRSDKSISTGSDYREGASLSYRNNTEPILLPSEIMGLIDLEGIIKFANYWPVKSMLEYTEHPKTNEGFIMRPDLTFVDKTPVSKGKGE